MSVYYTIFFVTLLLQFIKVESDSKYLVRTIISFVPLLIYGALRVDYGLDYPTYEEMFNSIHQSGQIGVLEYREEIGYQLLNKIIPSWRLLLVITTVLNCSSYVYIMYKYVPSKYSWLFIIFFFLTGNFSFVFDFVGIRNGIIISILLLSTDLIKQRKLVPFSIVVVIASLFHRSALLYFPITYIVGRCTKLSNIEYRIWLTILIVLLIIPFDQFVQLSIPAMEILGMDNYSLYFAEKEGITLLIKITSTLCAFVFLNFMRNDELTEDENCIGRLATLYFVFQLLGGLSGRAPQTYVLYVIAFVVIMYQKSTKIPLRYGVTGYMIAYYSYAFFIVWMNSPYFVMQTYHSILSR